MTEEDRSGRMVATVEIEYNNPNVDVAMAAESAKNEAQSITSGCHYDVSAEVKKIERRENDGR